MRRHRIFSFALIALGLVTVRSPVNGEDLKEARPEASGAVVLEPQVIHDPKTKLEVITLLVPQGWTVQEDMLWRPLAAQYVALTSSVFDRKSGWALRWLPGDKFNCAPIVARSARQQGLPPFQSGMELCEGVPNCKEYVQQIVLPRYRNIQGLQVVEAEELKELARQIEQSEEFDHKLAQQAGFESRLSAARVRVEYPGPGDTPLQEDIYCVLSVMWNVQGNANARNLGLIGGESFVFSPERLYGFTAPKGQLDAATPLLQTIQCSARTTVRWDSYVTNLNALIQQIALDDHAMETAARAQITESQRNAWEERSKSADRISEEVSHLLRGTQAFPNPEPNKPTIVVPAKTTAWINTQGQVVYSDSLQFDPNKAPNNDGRTWTQLKPAP